MSDYLWDGEGDDAEVAQLEAVLSPLAYRGRPPSLPPPPRRRRAWLMAGAAAAVPLMIALFLVWRWPRPEPASWALTVESAEGQPLSQGKLLVGAWLDTGENRARLRIAQIGTVELMPKTRARIVESGNERQVLRLDRGSISAVVNAPPRHFLVETPRTTVIDLGCAFTLSVDESGQGKLVVSDGAVALVNAGAAEVVVPAGSECGFSERGPGAPAKTEAKAGTGTGTQTGTGTGTQTGTGAQTGTGTQTGMQTQTQTGTQTQTQTRTRTRTPGTRTQTQTQMQTRTAETPTPTPPTKKPTTTSAPTQKPPSTSTDLSHDSLKDLDRSIP